MFSSEEDLGRSAPWSRRSQPAGLRRRTLVVLDARCRWCRARGNAACGSAFYGAEMGLGLLTRRTTLRTLKRTAGTREDFWAYITKPLVRSRLLRDAMCRALDSSAATQPPKLPAAPTASAAIRTPALANLIRVLVAEDNSVNQMVAVRLLERLGCRVDVAGNGAEAVQMATRLPYHLIFMDCHMPEMDGFDATVEIRRRETEVGLMPMPIVALTASVLQEDRDRCVSAGMNDIIGKPVQPSELAHVLRRFAPKEVPDAVV